MKSKQACNKTKSTPALPKYLREDIERVQKRTLHVICPEYTYEDNLNRFNLSSLGSRRESACSKLFNDMCSPSHKLHHLVHHRHQPKYNLKILELSAELIR